MSVVEVVLLIVFVILAALVVGAVVASRRPAREKKVVNFDRPATLSVIDNPKESVDTYTSPVPGRFERKTGLTNSPIVKEPHGSRRVNSLGYGLNYDDEYRPEPIDLNPYDK